MVDTYTNEQLEKYFRERLARESKSRTAAKKLKRAQREMELAAATSRASETLGIKRYNVIYADPPWAFETYSENGKDRSADNHYPCMDLATIKALPVPAADDAVVFLWTTVPMLPQAFEVLTAWGFEYKSTITWVKPHAGTGCWARNRTEFLLIGTRGKIPAPAPSTQSDSVIEAPRGRHSEKPAIFAELIERLFPTAPKVEMFCRTPRSGWNPWGNEAAE